MLYEEPSSRAHCHAGPPRSTVVEPAAPPVSHECAGSPCRYRVGSCLDRTFWRELRQVPFSPSPDSHLIDMSKPHEAPAEEFRTLRTRLNHLQTLQPIHTVVITSPSPAEGKSFGAVNLALAEAQLEGNPTLLSRLRLPPSDCAQSLSGGAVAGIDRLPDKVRPSWRIASNESGIPIYIYTPGGRSSDQSTGTAEPA